MSNKKLSPDWVFTFGKYKGKPLKEVIIANHRYVLWCKREVSWFDVDDQCNNLIISIISHNDYLDSEHEGYDDILSGTECF